MKKLRYIKKELINLYGKEKTKEIVSLAKKYYNELSNISVGATKGEWLHLKSIILPTVTFYKALLDVDRNNALKNIDRIIINLCEKFGKTLNIVLKFPGMKSMFIKLLPKIAIKKFGSECGFKYEYFEANKECFKMNMTICPYVKFTRLFKVEELAYIFCESDFVTYGKLNGIEFERTETLATGGNKCDFIFRRIKNKK